MLNMLMIYLFLCSGTHAYQSLSGAKMWLSMVQCLNQIHVTAWGPRASLNNLASLQMVSSTHEGTETKSQIIGFASSALLLWQIKEVWKPYFSEQRVLSLSLANRLTNWLVLIAAKALQQPWSSRPGLWYSTRTCRKGHNVFWAD